MWLSPPRLLLYALVLVSLAAGALAAVTPRASTSRPATPQQKALEVLTARLDVERLEVHEELRELLAALLERNDEQRLLLPHEEDRLLAQLAIEEHAILRLSRGRGAPEGLLAEEPRRPWLSDAALDLTQLKGRLLARGEEAETAWAEGEVRRLARLSLEATVLEREVIPAAARALSSVLEALLLEQAPLVDLLSTMQLVKSQRLLAIELRAEREQVLIELAKRLGCEVEALPWRHPTS